MQHEKEIENNQFLCQESIVAINEIEKEQPDKTKKKSKLIFKKIKNNVPLLLNYSYIFKISESLIINERALKEPTLCHESFMASTFYFKSIQNLSINQHFISLNLKEVQKNQFPISYYTERFKSFGDKDFYELAQSIELLDLELTKKCIQPELYLEKEEEKKLMKKQLADLMEEKKGKKILCFYSEPTGNHITMNRIVVSTELFHALGYNVEDLCKDFLRYRHVFFEIFDTSFYCSIVKKVRQRLNSMKEEKFEVVEEKENRKCNKNEETFTNYIFRVREDEKGLFEEKLPAKITFSRPYSHLSVYEIVDIDESNILTTVPKKVIKNSRELQEYEEKIKFEERKTLACLDYNNLEV